MKKDIGSIFCLNSQTLQKAQHADDLISKDFLQYSLCREALYDIAISHGDSNRKILIPAYTCQTVITPFKEAGWCCYYFNIKKDLRVDLYDLVEKARVIQPTIVLVHPYFGMGLNRAEEECLTLLHKKGVYVVLDLTQSIFSSKDFEFVDYYVGSYRKWFAIPDGGFLINNTNCTIREPQTENEAFVSREIDAMYLRNLYFRIGEQKIKDISIKLSKSADHLSEVKIFPHKMSKISCFLLKHSDSDENQKRRINNFNYLHQYVKYTDKLLPVCSDLSYVTSAPLYYTLYVEDRFGLQNHLSSNSIYAPVLWPVEDESVLISDEVFFIYTHLLAIPIDKRYGLDDMARIVDVINDFLS